MTGNSCFSALQRAENSSIRLRCWRMRRNCTFQCSSASRKFLNPRRVVISHGSDASFSALQRAENSSIFIFPLDNRASLVSVLFSEPKIPQYQPTATPAPHKRGFSALQRAENSSTKTRRVSGIIRFQCSSASRKFLNVLVKFRVFAALCFSALQRAENSSIIVSSSFVVCYEVSVLFSEPKIPQSAPR